MTFGPAAGLGLVVTQTSEPSLKGYHPWPSPRDPIKPTVFVLCVVKIRLLRKISNLQEPAFRSTASCKMGP